MNITLTKEELLECLKKAYYEGFCEGKSFGEDGFFLSPDSFTYYWVNSDAIDIPNEIGDVIE